MLYGGRLPKGWAYILFVKMDIELGKATKISFTNSVIN